MNVLLISRETPNISFYIIILFRIFLVADIGYHRLNILSDLHEISVKDALTFIS